MKAGSENTAASNRFVISQREIKSLVYLSYYQVGLRVDGLGSGIGEVIKLSDKPHVVIKENPNSLVVIPLDESQILDLPEESWEDRMTADYVGDLSMNDAFEIPGTYRWALAEDEPL